MHRPIANDDDPQVCTYAGWLIAVIWVIGMFGSWALVLGAGALAQWLFERIIALGAL